MTVSKRYVCIAALLIGAGAGATAPSPQVLVEQAAHRDAGRPKIELLVLESNQVMFRIRTTVTTTRAGQKPELDRGYSLFCGEWHKGSQNTIAVTDRLAESYQYPALDADRAGPHNMMLTTTGTNSAGLPATASNADHRYAPVPRLQFDAAQIERIKFTCTQASAAAKAK